MRTLVSELSSKVGAEVTLYGWVHRIRDLGGVSFVLLRDRSGSAQLVFDARPDVTLESVIRAEGKRYLMANVPRNMLAEVKRILPGISGPTIVDVLDSGEFVAAHAVVDRRDVYRTIAQLKDIGATGILVTHIERLMP